MKLMECGKMKKRESKRKKPFQFSMNTLFHTINASAFMASGEKIVHNLESPTNYEETITCGILGAYIGGIIYTLVGLSYEFSKVIYKDSQNNFP